MNERKAASSRLSFSPFPALNPAAPLSIIPFRERVRRRILGQTFQYRFTNELTRFITEISPIPCEFDLILVERVLPSSGARLGLNRGRGFGGLALK